MANGRRPATSSCAIEVLRRKTASQTRKTRESVSAPLSDQFGKIYASIIEVRQCRPLRPPTYYTHHEAEEPDMFSRMGIL